MAHLLRSVRASYPAHMPRVIAFQPGSQTTFAQSSADFCIYAGVPGSGKLLPLGTRVPTPDGWTTMGALRPGDRVFGLDGEPTVVQWVSAPELPRRAIELTFDDGTQIVSADTHLWLTYDRRETRPLDMLLAIAQGRPRMQRRRGRVEKVSVPAVRGPSVRTTADIVRTLRAPGGANFNHMIPVSGAVQCAHVDDLPLDPYMLGLWLGDGHSHTAALTSMDAELFEVFAAAGFELGVPQLKPDNRAWSRTIKGMNTILRELNVLCNKHVPEMYMRASEAQRLALMQGLIDTDGHVDPNKHTVEYSTTEPRLASAVHELACSLGWKSTKREGRAKLYGVDCGPKWRVCFSAQQEPCRLQRKLKSWRTPVRETTRRRYIVAARDVEPELMCCIAVDNADHTYLITDSWIATHNSFAGMLDLFRWTRPELQRIYPQFKPENFLGIGFRKNAKQLMSGQSSLWGILRKLCAVDMTQPSLARSPTPVVRWATGAEVVLGHAQYVESREAHDGQEYAVQFFDELQHFDADFFWYLAMLRSRTTCGLKPYVRASCMPTPDTFVHELVKPWLYEGGWPDYTQSGRVRWFLRDANDQLQFFGAKRDADEHARMLAASDPTLTNLRPRSLAIVHARTEENQILMRADPDYLSKIAGGDRVLRMRMQGCWEARPKPNGMFDRNWYKVIEELPSADQIEYSCRGWDKASTRPSEENDNPDYTRGVRLDLLKNGIIVVSSVVSLRDNAGKVMELIQKTAEHDGPKVEQAFWRGPSDTGDSDEAFVRFNLGRVSGVGPVTFERAINKIIAAEPISAYADQTRDDYTPGLAIVRAPWNGAYFAELELFPAAKLPDGTRAKDDQVDAQSRASMSVLARTKARQHTVSAYRDMAKYM